MKIAASVIDAIQGKEIKMGDTPETDAIEALMQSMAADAIDYRNLARNLEYRLAASYQEIAVLRQRLAGIDKTLRDRIEWLRGQPLGGDWEHLKTRADEASYILQKLFSGAALSQEKP